MKDAEEHAGEDKERKAAVESRNQADQAVYGAEKFLKESGDKIDAEDRLAIETATGDVKKALEGGDDTAISRTLKALMSAQQKAAEKLYAAAAGAPGGAPGGDAGPEAPGGSEPSGEAGGDDVIDAEVVEEKK